MTTTTVKDLIDAGAEDIVLERYGECVVCVEIVDGRCVCFGEDYWPSRREIGAQLTAAGYRMGCAMTANGVTTENWYLESPEDATIRSLYDLICGASDVELRYDAESVGVTRVVARAFSEDGKRIGIRRWGFAKRAAAEETLANIRKALNGRGYVLEARIGTVETHEPHTRWTHEYYSYQD